MTDPGPHLVLAVVPDLFFATRIASTAKGSGVTFELVPPQRAAERAGEAQAWLILIDLHTADAVALVGALKAAAPHTPLVGFYSHVETELRHDALAAGADAALPRSAFTVKLHDLLTWGMAALSSKEQE